MMNDEMTGKGLAQGEQIILRPVLEQDLERLAYLLGESPFGIGQDALPWTAARLKKKFEDAENPGLWGDRRFTFAVARLSGGVVGFIDCTRDSCGGLWITLHVQQGLADCDSLGRDALATFMAMARKWHNLPRVATAVVACEQEKCGWYRDAGFELEIRAEEAQLYQGCFHDILIYGWLAESTIANRAPDGIGA
jgi:hypothetical protein